MIFAGNSFEGIQILDEILFNDLKLNKIFESGEIEKLEVYLDDDDVDVPSWYELTALNYSDENDDPDYLESDRVKIRFTFRSTAAGKSYNFTYKIIQKSNGKVLAQTTAILKVCLDYQEAPSEINGVAPTSAANDDGKITGTTTAMEYKLSSASDWIIANATETIVLPGNYHIRYAATGEKPASPTVNVTVNSYGTIKGIAIPVRKNTPVITIEETPQYTGTVAWEPNHTLFRSSTIYKATITLTAKSGFNFDSITENLFTVQGATTTNVAKTNVITAIFPKTIIASSVTLGEIKRTAEDDTSRIRLLEDIDEDGHPSEFFTGAEEAVGQTIGLQILPKTGYRLKAETIKAVYNDGTEKLLDLTPIYVDGLAAIYLFKMPAFPVVVTAEFEKIPT